MGNAMSSLDELVKGEVGRVRRRAEGFGQRRGQRVQGVVVVVMVVIVMTVAVAAAAETLEGRSEGILQLGYSPVDSLLAVGPHSMLFCSVESGQNHQIHVRYQAIKRGQFIHFNQVH